ncbi:MAG: esterase/lipase family protein [Oceanococcus sp.]
MDVAKTLQGAARLGFDTVEGVTNIAEGMYRNIAALPRPLGPAPEGRAPGIAGFVHESIRQVNGAVRLGIDPALELAKRHLEYEAPDSMASVALISALNGLIGDHLERTDNPLAIQMDLVSQTDTPSPDLLIMVHGLAMHHSFFGWKGHNHGEAIAQEHGFTPVYAHYNSGRHISVNGRELADQIEKLVDEWPMPVRSIRFIGYSMGGLLTRSTLHAATEKGLRWPALTRQAVYLASPHHGSAVERGGNWFNAAFKISPYSAPLAALGMVRSAGITDLRHGNVVDQDWQDQGRFEHHDDRRQPTALAEGIEHFVIAGSLAAHKNDVLKRPLGDGLVAPRSALGDHKDPSRDLGVPENNRLLVTSTGHLELLGHLTVFHRMKEWLAPS